ncbi:MAG: lamin tail domain-containing protein [Deltaproteobacteria bacterium]
MEAGTDASRDVTRDGADAAPDAPCSPDLMTDPRNCGACRNNCTTLPGVSSAIRCLAGVCDLTSGCAAGRAHCSTTPGDGCETAVTTASSCGACGAACAEPTPMCSAMPSDGGGPHYACSSGCTGTTPTRCAMSCTNTQTDTAHCGSCTVACTPPAHATSSCAAGVCGFGCDAGYAAQAGACVQAYAVGGTVAGLAAGAVTLQNNGRDDLIVNASGAFTFARGLVDGATYAVTVARNPPGQVCTVSAGTGAVAAASVTSVVVTCRTASVAINEVLARPASGAYGDASGDGVRDSATDEFIEILNNEAIAIDLSGWVLRTGTTAPPAVRLTWADGTILTPGQRTVIFGGGVPAGGFGGAQVEIATLSLTDGPTAPFAISLESATAGGIVVDSFTYDATTFGSSCTTACASRVRSPEGTGAFVAHGTVSGSAGILWSPGVAATAAIPKVELPFSSPTGGALHVSVTTGIVVQFGMYMTATEFTNANLRLYASTCAARTSEITAFTSIGAGADASSARLVPASSLAFATTYCVSVSGLHSAAGTALTAPVSYEFTTRTAASAPATTVVISEYGAASFSTNDEFVELYNPTAAAVDISGWSLQRRTAAGTASCWATLPAGSMIAPGGFFLVGGVGYTPASYGGVTADFTGTGTALTGANESVLLVAAPATCTTATGAVDAVSVGNITDTVAVLSLPALPGTIAAGTSIERKACFDSTGDASVTTGLWTGGGHAAQGNSEHVGSSNADWVSRATPLPQNAASAIETRTCL